MPAAAIREHPSPRWSAGGLRGQDSEAGVFAAPDLLGLEVDLLFFVTTSTYFGRAEPDQIGEDGAPAFRAYGHNRTTTPTYRRWSAGSWSPGRGSRSGARVAVASDARRRPGTRTS